VGTRVSSPFVFPGDSRDFLYVRVTVYSAVAAGIVFSTLPTYAGYIYDNLREIVANAVSIGIISVFVAFLMMAIAVILILFPWFLIADADMGSRYVTAATTGYLTAIVPATYYALVETVWRVSTD
jgi:hypothetical protein